jgi:GDP-4-dehydro-6-deoxy-D-mannose reductase
VKALITGVCGFIGLHLARHLASLGHEVHGVDLEGRTAPANCDLHHGSIEDSGWIRTFLQEHRFDVLYHLAGLNGDRPALDIYRANVVGSAALLEGIAAVTNPPRTLLVSSSAAYGAPLQAETPTDESAELRPLTPYGVSKAAVDLMGFQYAAKGLPIIRVRPFNIIGPGQSPSFLLPSVAAQLVAIAAGRQAPTLRLGDLSGVRDFLDVRDFVRALAQLAKDGHPGEIYNACSGTPIAVKDVVKNLVALAGIEVSIESDPARTRLANVPYQVGSHARLTQLTDWRPEISLSQSLVDLLEWQRAQERSA